MIGFAPSQPCLFDYIATVERLTKSKLSPEERDWAATSRNGDIPAERFAGWLALSANSQQIKENP